MSYNFRIGGVTEVQSDDDMPAQNGDPRHQNRRIPVVAPSPQVPYGRRGAWAPGMDSMGDYNFGAAGAVPARFSPTNVIAQIDASTANVLSKVPGLFAALDKVPPAPSYPNFKNDFKTRPVSAFMNLLTPLENLAKDTIIYAVQIGGLTSLTITPPGVPAVNVKMGLKLPPQITDPTVVEFMTRLLTAEQWMILGYMRPHLLAAGFAKALVEEAKRGVQQAAKVAGIVTGLVRSAQAGGFSLGAVAPSYPTKPGSAFMTALIPLLKSSFPTLPLFRDIAAAAAAAAQQAAAAAQAAAKNLSRVTPVILQYNALLARVGPQNIGLVNEVYARGDTDLKNFADKIKLDAIGAMQALGSNIPNGIKGMLNTVISNCEVIKTHASDIQGRKGNRVPLPSSQLYASNAPGQAKFRPDASDLLVVPTSFAGLGGMGDAPGYNFGAAVVDDAAGGAVAAEGGATVVTVTGTSEVAAPAAAPPVATGIGAALTAAVEAAIVASVTTASAAATTAVVREGEGALATGGDLATQAGSGIIPGAGGGQPSSQPSTQTQPNNTPQQRPQGAGAGSQQSSGGGLALGLGAIALLGLALSKKGR